MSLETTGWQLTGGSPGNYERYLVPETFAPLAQILVRQSALRPGQRVLDVACGTGIVARHAARQVAPDGFVVGVDLNAGMLDVARQTAPTDAARLEWRQGDATNLPCETASFDVVLCQQGLQFFPDKVAALRDMRRVLRPGGCLGLSVWHAIEHCPYYLAVSASLGRHVGDDLARLIHPPFSFGDPDELKSVMSQAGFRGVEIQTNTVLRRLSSTRESHLNILASTPLAPAIAALAEPTRAAIINDIDTALAMYHDGDGLTVPQPTYVALAVS